jgi:hypothetical protein
LGITLISSQLFQCLNVCFQKLLFEDRGNSFVNRSVELLLIHIGPHQILMEQKKMLCIVLVLLVRYMNFIQLNYSLNLYGISIILKICTTQYSSLINKTYAVMAYLVTSRYKHK